MRRGRPPYPDILTPREWEVLELLRGGLTNQQIADKLGISERGAKFHVSEILSKLGLESRYEAASWQRSTPAWGLAFFTQQPWPIKVAAALVLLLGSAAAVGVATSSPTITKDSARQSVTPTPINESFLTSFCEREDVQCLQTHTTSPTTLDAAANSVSFIPIFPTSPPSGFTQKDIHQFSGRDPAEATDTIVVSYRNPTGKELIISQGYLIHQSSMFWDAPEPLKGKDVIGGLTLYWYRGQHKVTCCPTHTEDWEDNGWISVFLVAETLGSHPHRIREQEITPPDPSFPRTAFTVSIDSTSTNDSGKSTATEIFLGLSSNGLTAEELMSIAFSMAETR